MRAEHPAFFESSGHRGAATLSEVSYSGAGLQAKNSGLAIGEPVRILVWPANQAEPFEIAARVVGLSEGGFAVEYEEPGQAICQWIDALHIAEAKPPPTAEAHCGVES
jgi:hypothetical protein